MADTVDKKTRSYIMSQIRSKGTKPEIAVHNIIACLGWKSTWNRRDLPGTPDIVFDKVKLAIMVNGCFWHSHASGSCKGKTKPIPESNALYWRDKFIKVKKSDMQNRRALRAMGYSVLTIWECELRHPEKVAAKIARKKLSLELKQASDIISMVGKNLTSSIHHQWGACQSVRPTRPTDERRTGNENH